MTTTDNTKVAQSNIPTELGGRFVIQSKIAERPNCTVYKAIDRNLGDRPVAIKIFIDSPQGKQEWIDKFSSEVDVLRGASHPSLVPILAGGHENSAFYLAMELIEGQTLRDYLKEKAGPLDVETAINYITQICAGLKEIHERHGFHGHIDSRAILFKGNDPKLAGYYPHVISAIQKSVTTMGRFAVDPVYVSPEQVSGAEEADGRADIYAISILLYEMLTGQKPFSSNNPLQLAMMRLSKDPDSPRKLNANISPLLDAAVMKGLSRDPKERFSSVPDFVDALTGGKKVVKNPLLAAMEEEGLDKMSTSTIAVSMSTDAIKHILQMQAAKSTKDIKSETATQASVTRAAPEEPLDAVATMMGMKTDQIIKGSLMVVAGEQRGKKFLLEKPQTMIGSDSGCEIVFSGKGIPPRYAIIVQKGSDYMVGPLSPTKLTINGVEVESSEEVPLKRGDVLHVGTNQLRFVAPGEVFTLHDDVADRTIDRPKSKLPLILGASSLTALLICGLLFYSYRNSLAEKERRAKLEMDVKNKQKIELVDRLRREGDEFFRLNQLIEPLGNNARDRFEKIRELLPDDAYAKRRLVEIEDRVKILSEQNERKRQFADRIQKLLTDGDRFLKAGALVAPPGSNAREAFQEVLRLDSQNQGATKGLAEINRVLGDLAGKLNSLLSRSRVLIDLGQYIEPSGDNAFDLMQQVLSVDPANTEAKSLVIDMAARSLLEGDAARAEVRTEDMKRAYLTAKAIGVDPDLVDKRLRGVDIMQRSTSSVVIIDRASDKGAEKKSDPRFLNSTSLDDRISVLQAQGYAKASGGDRKLVEINKR